MSNTELHAHRSSEVAADLSEAISGKGFTSRRGNGMHNNCALVSSNGQCIVYKDILTPGSVLQESVSSVINHELAWITNADELNEVLTEMTRLLLNRILNLSRPDYTQQEPYELESYPGRSGDPRKVMMRHLTLLKYLNVIMEKMMMLMAW